MRRVFLVLACLGCETRAIDHGVTEAESRFAEDAATAYCETMVQCDCPDHVAPYQDVAACIEKESAAISERQRRAENAGLRFDAECAAFMVQRWRDLRCDDQEAASERLRPGEAGLFPSCRLYYGSVARDDQCETAFGTHWNDCEPGTTCSNDEGCQPTDPVLADPPGLGESCWWGGGHGARYSCEPGLYCTGNDDAATCQPYAEEGESCIAAQCIDGLLCDHGATDTCRAPRSLGAPCSELSALRCDEGLFCDHVFLVETEGTCQPLREPNDACRLPGACRIGWCTCGDVEDACDGTCATEGPGSDPQPPSTEAVICEPGWNLQPAEMF